MTRLAVGRRVLQVVLPAGGLFALGLLFAGQAHAADGKAPTTPTPVVQTVANAVTGSLTSSVTSAVTGSVTSSVERLVASGGSAASEVGSGPWSTVTPGADTGADTGTVRDVVQPVGDLAGAVTGGLTESLTETLAQVTGDAPGQVPPALPGLPTLPGAGGGQTPPAAGSAQPPSSGASSGASGAAEERGAGQRQVIAGDRPAYGPDHVGSTARPGGAGTPRDDQAVRLVHAASASAPAPAHHVPLGNPTGVPDRRSAADHGGSRHGDAHAVTTHHRVPLRLVPGASVAVTVAETRDRFRDVPVFPG